MGKLDRLIDDIERASNDEKSVLSRKVYSDMPLVFTASQMKSFTPDRIMRFRREFRTRSVYTADPQMFLRQAQFMADYEDDYREKAEFSSAFPSYAAMNDSQLRTYFSWKTELKRGKLEKTSLSYAYVYIFELLNLVGVESPSEAFGKLRNFFEEYGKLDGAVLLYRARWLTDFAVYYGLEDVYGDLPCDDNASLHGGVLHEPENHTDGEVFHAAEFFSSYSIFRSAAYKAAPQLCERTVAAVVRGVSRFYGRSGFDELCCKRRKTSYFMFASAIVYMNERRSDRTVALPDGRVFSEINNHWLLTDFAKDGALSRELGALMRFVDIILRKKLKIKNKIKPVSLNSDLQAFVERCIDGVFDDIRREKIKKRMDGVKIDFANLDTIRRSSDETGERLMTEEDIGADNGKNGQSGIAFVKTDIVMPKSVGTAAEQTPVCTPKDAADASVGGAPSRSPISDGVFSDNTGSEERCSSAVQTADTDEKENDAALRVLRILLDGGDASETAKSAGVTLSMVCDEINERFYDEFYDTVIDFDNDVPFVVPDYAEDLRGMLE